MRMLRTLLLPAFVLIPTPVIFGDIITTPVVNLVALGDPLMVDLGQGPISTGPITVSLERGPVSFARFDFGEGTMEVDLYLEIDFPLLATIGSGRPTLRVREIGPVTWGIETTTGTFRGWSSLSGGGIIDPGTPFEGGIFFNINNHIIFPAENEQAPVTEPQDPPVDFPGIFIPFPPQTQPRRPELPDDGWLRTDPEESGLRFGAFLGSAGEGDVSIGVGALLRFSPQQSPLIPPQQGDIPVFASGRMTIVPEPGSLTLFGLGGIGLFAYSWRYRKRTGGRGQITPSA